MQKVKSKTKSYDIMDVNKDAVLDAMARHNADLLIHGHTHRPAFHDLENNKQRIVLGDWYTNSSILEVTADNIELVSNPL